MCYHNEIRSEMLEYKRISKGFWNYALYPIDTDLDALIKKNGSENDYYYSIYNYNQSHYDKFTTNLKQVCTELKIPYKENDLINVVAQVYKAIRPFDKKNADEIKGRFSVSGTEDVITNKIVFDFDDKDVSLSQKDTILACERLMKHGVEEEALQISFSGNKGFSVEIDTNQDFSRAEFESLIYKFAGDLKTFDDKIKDEQRLFRIPLTRHNSSGLYKIPLRYDELLNYSVDDIKQEAHPLFVKQNRSKFFDVMNEWKFTEATFQPTIIPETSKETIDLILGDGLDLSHKPNWMSHSKYALQEGYFVEGERNTAFMILAATYRANGFNDTMAYGMLQAVAQAQAQRNNSDPFPEDELKRNIVDYVYSERWKGGTYSERETKLLQTIKERLGIKEESDEDRIRQLYTVSESLNRFQEYAQNFSKNRVKLGLPQLDDNLVLTTGMTIGILGSPGSGKTTLSNYFMKYTSKNNERILFESLDMSENFIMARFLQNYVDMDFEQIMTSLENNTMSKELMDAMDSVSHDYQNVSMNFKSGTNVEDIENDLKKHNDLYGSYPRLVVIDYLEKLRGPYSDSNANTSYIISRLTDLAKEYNTCIIILLQPQKNAGDPRYPLLSMRKVKGASTIEQDCRVILTLWRPGFNPKTMEDDKYMSIAVVKNNMGRLGQYDFAWDGLSGHLRDLSEDERYALQDLSTRLEEERASEQESFNGY